MTMVLNSAVQTLLPLPRRTSFSILHPRRNTQANGLAERTVRTAKSILLKASKHGNDPNLALLDYRNTPISGVGESPVQLMMGRRTRTLLPTSANLLQPSYNTNHVKSSLEEKQAKQKHYYDRNTRSLEPLKLGDQVRLRDGDAGIWIPATVKNIADEPRSYIVEANGHEYRRNRRDLLKLPAVTSNDTEKTVDVNIEPKCSSQEENLQNATADKVWSYCKATYQTGI